MNTSIVGKQFDLTEPIKAYIDSAVDSLKKYNLDVISVRTVISADEKNGKKGFSVEFAINMAHKNTVVIQQKDKDVKIVKLIRNFGHEIAMTAGMDYATGDAIVFMDADGQHDPADIPKFIEKADHYMYLNKNVKK